MRFFQKMFRGLPKMNERKIVQLKNNFIPTRLQEREIRTLPKSMTSDQKNIVNGLVLLMCIVTMFSPCRKRFRLNTLSISTIILKKI